MTKTILIDTFHCFYHTIKAYNPQILQPCFGYTSKNHPFKYHYYNMKNKMRFLQVLLQVLQFVAGFSCSSPNKSLVTFKKSTICHSSTKMDLLTISDFLHTSAPTLHYMHSTKLFRILLSSAGSYNYTVWKFFWFLYIITIMFFP